MYYFDISNEIKGNAYNTLCFLFLIVKKDNILFTISHI